MAASSVNQLSLFKQELKNFINGKQTGDDFFRLLMTYEKTRKTVKVTDILTAIEEQTKTRISDELSTLF